MSVARGDACGITSWQIKKNVTNKQGSMTNWTDDGLQKGWIGVQNCKSFNGEGDIKKSSTQDIWVLSTNITEAELEMIQFTS